MASLIVAGDTSGTVTLQAPAIAGSTVLTLPTTSGTLVTTAGGTTVPFALGSAASPSITFTGDTNTGIFSPGADTIAFSEGGVESMRIDSGGNVGIATTPVTNTVSKLFVGGDLTRVGSSGGFNFNAYYDIGQARWEYAGTGTAATWVDSGSGNYTFQSSGSTTGNAGDPASLVERLRIGNAGTIILQGGNTSATGVGITFPATQSASSDANTLDDYEEGTFSPTILGGSVAGTATYSRQNGIYTKIGNRVFFTIQVEWSSGTGSGALIIGGLPFTQNGGGSDTPYSASEWSNVAWDANYTPTPVGQHNTTNIFINASRVGASGTSINTTYDAAGYFTMTGHYRIA